MGRRDLGCFHHQGWLVQPLEDAGGGVGGSHSLKDGGQSSLGLVVAHRDSVEPTPGDAGLDAPSCASGGRCSRKKAGRPASHHRYSSLEEGGTWGASQLRTTCRDPKIQASVLKLLHKLVSFLFFLMENRLVRKASTILHKRTTTHQCHFSAILLHSIFFHFCKS